MDINVILYYFKYVFPSFVVQLVGCEVVFLVGLKLRRLFFPKLFVGFSMLAVLVFLASVVAEPLKNIPFGGVFVFAGVELYLAFRREKQGVEA